MGEQQKTDPKDEKQVDLDTLLAELGGGIRLTVHRIEPLWCDGYLGTIEVDEDDTISLENLRELFGGRKLKCKILDDKGNIRAVRTCKFPDPPRKDGCELKQPNPNDEKDKGTDKGSDQSELLSMFSKSQETMVTMAREHNESMQKLMTEKLQPQAQPTQPQSSEFMGLKNAMEIVDWVENLRNRVKDPSQDVNPLHAQMLGMVEKFFSHKLDMDAMSKEAEIEKDKSPELPERQSSQPSIDSVDDKTLLEKAAERFQSLPLMQQKEAAELFFKSVSTGNATSGQDQDNDLGSIDTQKQDIDSAASLEDQDPDLVLDPDDAEQLRAESNEGGIPTS